jgi:hypothetical protein
LEERIRSDRSEHTDIVQQDLFFVGSCLTEDIPVENDLAEVIVSQLCDLVIVSPYSSQRSEALQTLAALTHSRQYTSLARQKLKTLDARDLISSATAIEVATILFQISINMWEDQQIALQSLQRLAQRSDLPIEQTIQAAQSLYQSGPADSEAKQIATQLLLALAQRSDLPIEQTIQAAQALYQSGPARSEAKQIATQLLLALAQRSDLPTEQTIQVGQILYENSEIKSEEERQAAEVLWQSVQKPTLTAEQKLNVVSIFIKMPSVNYMDMLQSIQFLISLLGEVGAKTFLEKHQQDIDINEEASVTDLPYIVRLTQNKILPSMHRDKMYKVLREMIPQFDELTRTSE